ncbi:MAG: hypothetical protein QNJ88_17260 [Acidimicrobiia bacterium]|nr:hypothetical protein [Acidimicrobiia bacterium]
MNQQRTILTTIVRFLVGLAGLGVLAFGLFIALLMHEFADTFGGRADYAPALLFIVPGVLVLAALVVTTRFRSRAVSPRTSPTTRARTPDLLQPCGHCGRSIDVRRPVCCFCGERLPFD